MLTAFFVQGSFYLWVLTAMQFGMGNKLVKHWNFKGKHTGVFFGISPTNKLVAINGGTLVRMQGGKIAEERDYLNNLDFM